MTSTPGNTVFIGATAGSNGSTGLVPLPTAGEQTLFLRGDATWAAGGGGGGGNVTGPGVSVNNDIVVFNGTSGTSIADSGINISALTGVPAQIVYVDPNGSDSTGTGSPLLPFLTIGHALSTITTSSSTKPYVVQINPGTYSETGLEIPVWVFLNGSAQQPTKIIDSSGAIKINSASFSAGSERIGFSNLNLINSTGITVDFQAIGGAGSNQVYLNNNQIVGPVIFRGRGSDALTSFDNRFFGTYTSSAMQEEHFSGYFANTVTFNSSGVTGVAVSPGFTSMSFFSNATFTSSGAGNTMTPTMVSCPQSGTLTVDQATTTLSADEVSLNAATLSQTNGGLITYLSLAKYEGYTPGVSGNWSVVPTQVAQALDELAATGAIGPFTAGSVIFSNGTKLTQDNANLNWNDSTYTLAVTQPSSLGTLDTVLKVTSDPSGSHGHGNHIEIAGNPGGGGTIFRTDGGLNKSVLQLYGGDYTGTTGGAIYLNGNNSTSGDAGGVQTTFGLSSSTFDMYDNTQSVLLFQVTNSGVLKLPQLGANSYIGTDGSSNIVVKSAPGGFPWTSVAGTSQTLAANNGYFAANAGLTTFTLPAAAAIGDTYIVSADGAGLFTVHQNALQSIRYGNQVTTVGTGGNITATSQGDTLTIVCKAVNTGFQVIDSEGMLNIT